MTGAGPAGEVSVDPIGESSVDPIGESSGDPISETAARLFGVRYVYPQQRYIIANTLEGRNQIAVLPTGSGKSLCFQLPSQLLPGLTVVLVPILSLLADQVRKLDELRIPVGVLRGGQGAEERGRLLGGVRDGVLKIVYATPEVMLTRGVRDLLDGVVVANLVVDEAHCVCEWGETFRPAYLRLGEVVGALGPCAVTALTATGGPDIISRVREVLFGGADVLLYAANPDRPNISYDVVPVLSKDHALERVARSASRPLVVFARSRKSVERYARVLRRRLAEREVRFYHAGLDRGERREVEEWFLASREGILTATSAYGMGVDKPDIRTVIHADVPPSPEAYLQESGRAGRDGGPVRALLLSGPDDVRFAAGLDDVVSRRRYAQMLDYSLSVASCRRAVLLGYMGAEAEQCSTCDVCTGSALDIPEGEEEILAALAGQRRRFTEEQAAHFLAGARSYTAWQHGLERYPGYGALAGWERDDVEACLQELGRAGKIAAIRWGPWRGRLTVPRGRRSARARRPEGGGGS